MKIKKTNDLTRQMPSKQNVFILKTAFFFSFYLAVTREKKGEGEEWGWVYNF